MPIKYHGTNVNSKAADSTGSIYLDFLDLLDVDAASFASSGGFSVVVNDDETGLTFSDQGASIKLIVKIIPTSAFASITSPTDAEVYIWASDVLNVPVDERNSTYLLYSPIAGSTVNYDYLWKTYKIPSDIGLIRLRDLQNPKIILTPLDYEPSESGNTTNKNQFVESDVNQHWFIDIDGNGYNINKTAGDFEFTVSSKGLVTKSTSGDRFRQLTMDDGSIQTVGI